MLIMVCDTYTAIQTLDCRSITDLQRSLYDEKAALEMLYTCFGNAISL